MVKRKAPKKGKKRQKTITKREPAKKAASREASADDDSASEASEASDADSGEADDAGEENADADRANEDEEPPADDAPPSGEADDDDPEAIEGSADSDAAEEPSSDAQSAPEPAAAAAADLPAWTQPLSCLEEKWTWLETRLTFGALLLLTVVLCFWICVRGMSEPLEAEEAAGTLFRAIVGAGVLGGLARALSRGRLDEHRRNQMTVLAVLVGLLTAKLWRGVGIDYFQGLLAWLQEGSTVALFGGLKGLSTRLTMLVALLGASLAAATGTHINIDVVVRFIPKSLRKTVAIASAVATASVCLLASYGFIDFIAVTHFRADTNVSMTAKISKVSDGLGEQFFVWRKQLILDIDALPHVLAGGRYDDAERMNGRQWNAFVDAEGFAERYGAEKVAELKAPASDLDAPRIAFVTIPDGSPRGILVRGMDLVFPFGFFMIALRVLLRAALVAGGAASTALHGEPNPDESEDELASNESTAEAPS